MAAKLDRMVGVPLLLAVASMAAQRTRRDPILVIRPRTTFRSDSRCLGVSPAQEQSFSAEAKRLTSPISATKIAANSFPTPGIAWTAW